MATNRSKLILSGAVLALVLISAGRSRAADDLPKLPEIAGTIKAREPEITLKIGKPAPPFAVGTWIKGEPVDGLQAGQVSVVEFWATWCGPCLAGMPHISKLQTEYGDRVRIIGISREEEQVVREFLTQESEQGVTWDQTIAYSLAMDAEGRMTDTWFRAAGRRGIPSAFLVGRDGVIEWIGHPAAIDEPLAKVVAGTWDRAAAIAAYEAELKEQKATDALRSALPELSQAVGAENWTQAIAIVDDLLKDAPDSPILRLRKLSLLSQSGKSDEAKALLDELVQSDWEKGAFLPNLASGIAGAHFPGTLDDAERIAKRAVELTKETGLVQLHVLAAVYAEKGQFDEAIRWEKKALELAKDNKTIQRTLEKYEQMKSQGEQPPGDGTK